MRSDSSPIPRVRNIRGHFAGAGLHSVYSNCNQLPGRSPNRGREHSHLRGAAFTSKESIVYQRALQAFGALSGFGLATSSRLLGGRLRC